MKYIVVIGRILFSGIFLMTVRTHFSDQTVQHAALAGVPSACWLVPLSGIIAIAGGLSIALGYKAKGGAWLIAIFLVPVTLFMHAFWKESEDMQMQIQMANFFKNISLLGAALIIAYFGSGPLSIDTLVQDKVKGFTKTNLVPQNTGEEK